VTAHYGLGPELEQILRPGPDADLAAIAAAVRRLSDLFNGLSPWRAEYGRDPALRAAYLAYYLPTNLPKIRRPLEDWRRVRPRAFAGRPLRAIDLGTGPGTMLLGLADVVRRLPPEERPSRLELVGADEHAENLREAERLLSALAEADPVLPPVRFDSLRLDVIGDRRDLIPLAAGAGRFDLAILANVVCELEREPRGSAEELVLAVGRELLAPEGAIVVIEPALRDTARALERLRDRWLASGELFAVAPCVAPGPCPALVRERDWCVATLPWERPEWVAEIDRRTGLRKDALKLAYLLLAREAPPVRPGEWRVVSDVLDTKGELRVHLCGRSGEETRWVLLRHLKRRGGETEAVLRSLERGDRVHVEGLEPKGPLHVLGEHGTIRRLSDRA
jgi:ribosomal protein RSM22 (predicted rRNA methylase)